MTSSSASYKAVLTTEKNQPSCFSAVFAAFSSCFASSGNDITVNDVTYRIEKLIGEGGFSFVYEASCKNNNNNNNKEKYAIKKMIIQTKEQLSSAKWEIDVMQSLQKLAIQLNGNNNYHNYILPLIDYTIIMHDKIPEFKIVYMIFPYMSRGSLLDVLNKMKEPYMNEHLILTIFVKICSSILILHKHDPTWAHRDIKLANILLDYNDNPYLMDFGSVSNAHIYINNRNDALSLQEWSSKHCTPAYTPPELFDCPSNIKLDERTDTWSLGCLLYAMAFKKSPFETESGSCALSVLNGIIHYPDNHPYSKTFVSLISWMLNKKISQRPFVPAIIQRINDIIHNNNSPKK